MYELYHFASIIVPRLPRKFVMTIGKMIALAAWLIAHKARKQAAANMLHVLGPEVRSTRAGRRKLRRVVRGMFQNNVRNYLEMLYLPYMSPEEINRSMHIEGSEHLEAALALGKGVILFSAHCGPFDYIIQWLAIKGYEVTVPVERLKDERMLDLLLKLRRSKGLHHIPLGGNAPLRAIIQALRKNQIVLITADRAIQGESVEKPFFGALARLPIGPVELSQRTGAPLLGGFGWHSSHICEGHFVPLSLELSEEQRKNTDALMGGMIERMEQAISAHPEQWLVFAPVWKDDLPASPHALPEA